MGFLLVGPAGQISNLLIHDLKGFAEFVSLNRGLLNLGLTD
jgi:hypothetical protein